MTRNELSKLCLSLNFSLRHKVPILLQTEAAECGLACIGMIAGYHGKSFNILSLRQEHGISSRGASLVTLTNISKKIGLSSRALSLDLDELSRLTLPCILHWQFNHFVVLTKVTAKEFIINDPSRGRVKLNYKEMSENFTGVALELWPDVNFISNSNTLRIKSSELLKNIKGFTSALVKVFCLSLMIEFVSLLLPIGTQLVLDHVIPASDYSLLSVICLGLFIMAILQSGIVLWRSWSIIVIDTLTDLQWKDSFFHHLLSLPLFWFERRRIGDIQSRFNSLDTIRGTFIHDITGSIINIIIAVGALVMMILYGKILSIIVLIFTSTYVFLRIFTFSRYRQLSEERLIKNATANSYLTETLFGISTIRAQGLSDFRRRNWLMLTSDAANSTVTLDKFDMIFSVASAFISACDNFTILWFGISLVINGDMTIGAFIAFGIFRSILSERILLLTDIWLNFGMLTMHNDRVSDIALSTPEKQAPERNIYPVATPLKVIAENISFSYDIQSSKIFNKFNITINPGESVAITGPSGCGKTTLMKLLCGLSNPDEGHILVDGKCILTIGLNNYRKVISCILQEDRLLSGSLRDNICGFDYEKDENWLIECAKNSYIYDDIMTMPMGFDTLIGELGEGLSGGQKQRIFIARALYRRPGILFMDEATSHLDEDNEALINKAISSMEITRIIIAHRQSTISSADRVIFLK